MAERHHFQRDITEELRPERFSPAGRGLNNRIGVMGCVVLINGFSPRVRVLYLSVPFECICLKLPFTVSWLDSQRPLNKEFITEGTFTNRMHLYMGRKRSQVSKHVKHIQV